MSEFDVNLISAFAKCPAFYDKSNPNFKDRAFTENAWKEISLQLGFDEKVLRDRMFQLRNRYNLEKRKVEMQDGDPNAKSTWPLFDRMSFLEGHIRPRKSYKSIMNRSMESQHDQHSQFANNAMFFNPHRNNQQMRQYPQHPFAVQNAHNARLQQLAHQIQMMANNTDDPSIDMNGDSFPGIPELSLLEGDDRANPLNLFQQQQQQQLNLQQQQHQQQLLQRQQFMRREGGGSDNHSEIKAEYYSESDEDEDETDTTSKSKEDVGPFGQPSSSSAHVLGDLLNSVTEEGPSNARNENQSRNGTVSEPGGHSTGNDVDEAFLNPMDILMTRQSTGSAQNIRYSESMKRKSDTTMQQHNNSDGRSNSCPQTGPNTIYKRRRRNYQNMIPNGLMADPNSNGIIRQGGGGGMMMGTSHNQMSATALQGSNALLANQAAILAQLQNTLASQQTFLQQTQSPAMNPVMGASNSQALPDKYLAFGQFMASSLSELNGVKALDLIAKFTVEVVNALRERKSEGAANSAPVAVRTSPIAASSSSMQEPDQNHISNNNNHNHMNNLNANTASNHLQSNNIGEDKYQAHQF